MRVSLIVTTYERPDALARVLASVERQCVAPDEVLIADDGSSGPTQLTVAEFACRWPHQVEHLWQPHDGFGAGRARNRAIARATGEYVVLIDGDMILHPQFIADHRAAATPGRYLQGTRILLDAEHTAQILAGETAALTGPMAPGIGGRRRIYAIHSGLGSRMLRRVANTFVAIKSCNQGFWRSDLIRVNGFNESMTGWGYEDKELCARLERAGVKRRTLIFGAIAWHLHHPPAERSMVECNRQIYERTLAEPRVRAELGISACNGDAEAIERR